MEFAITDPATIMLNIYDSNRKIILGSVAITADHKISAGIYEYPYVVPINYNYSGLYYEFIGDADTLPAVARGVINTKWI